MSELLFGVVDEAGNLIAVGHKETSVVREAKRVAQGRAIIDMTVPAETLPRSNPSDSRKAPEIAFYATALPKVTQRQVMDLTLREAFERLQSAQVMEQVPKSWRDFRNFPLTSTLSDNYKMQKDVEKVFKKAGIDLAYNGYGPESIGLSLCPHNLAWKLTPKEEEEGGGRKGLLPKVARRSKATGKILYVTPTLCAYSTPECRTGCLVLTGQSGIGYMDLTGKTYEEMGVRRYRKAHTIASGPYKGQHVKKGQVRLEDAMVVSEQTTFYAKIRRTGLLFHDPVAYCRMLVEAIRITLCQNPNTHIRLNVLSDIPWEMFFPDLFKMFSTASFYDYTKIPNRKTPRNYSLVFSYSGRNISSVLSELDRGGGVAVVVYGKEGVQMDAPKHGAGALEQVKLWGYPTLNGDLYDIRSYDRAALRALGYPAQGGYLISLRYKAPKVITEKGTLVRRDEIGAFVVDVQYDEETGLFFGPETAAESAPTPTLRKGDKLRGSRRNPTGRVRRSRGIKWLD